ncbi:hypothetical protein GCM10027436_52850 [Actinophytocola sediminis]
MGNVAPSTKYGRPLPSLTQASRYRPRADGGAGLKLGGRGQGTSLRIGLLSGCVLSVMPGLPPASDYRFQLFEIERGAVVHLAEQIGRANPSDSRIRE